MHPALYVEMSCSKYSPVKGVLEALVLTASAMNLYKANVGRRQLSIFADEQSLYLLSGFGILMRCILRAECARDADSKPCQV